MTNETEAPERIWLAADLTTYCHDPLGLREDDIEYTRADLPDAKDKRIEELEDQLKMVLDRESATHSRHDAKTDKLEAHIAGLEAERDELTERVDELQQACEVVSSEFEGELWQSCRRLLQKTQFDFHGADVDGIQADAFESHMNETLVEFERAEARIAELEIKVKTASRNAQKYADDCISLESRIAELEAERDETMREALSLARSLHKTHYSDVTQWEPLDYPSGIISQIDNMVAGIVSRAEAAEAKLAKAEDAMASVEQWWLETGMHEGTGAPACIFSTRATLAELKGGKDE